MSTTNPTNITTEWDDLQRKFGNYAPLEKEATEEEKTKAFIEASEAVDPLAGKSLRELEALQEEAKEDDELLLNRYRQERINQIKQMKKRNRFGEVYTLRREEFIDEVTRASELAPNREHCNEKLKDEEDDEKISNSDDNAGTWVVVHLYQEHCEACIILNDCLNTIADQYKYIKFMKGIATNIVENYPDERLPTVLIYRGGACRFQIIGASDWGGKNITVQSITNSLKHKYKIIDEDDEEFRIRTTNERDNEQESSESSDEDRRIRTKGYSSLRLDAMFQKGF